VTKSLSLNVKVLIYIFIGYSFITPFYLAQHNYLSLVNKLFMILSILFVLIHYVNGISSKFISKSIILLLLYYGSLLASNYKNYSLEIQDITPIVMAVSFALLLDYSLHNRKELLNLLLGLNILTYLYVTVNLILIYIYPEGIPSIIEDRGRRFYLFGNVNTTTRYLIPGLMFSFLYDLLKYNKIRKRNWILLIMSWITLIEVWTVTGMIGLFIFTIFLIKKLGRTQAFILYISTLFGSMLLTIFLVFFKLESNLLANILGFFGKDMTFSYRDILWINAIDMINQNPLWGYGTLTEAEMEFYIGNSFSSHNYYLDVLLRGGIIALTILLFSLLYISRSIIKSRATMVVSLIIATCGAYFIMWTAEPFISTEIFMLPILLIMVSRIPTLENYYYDFDITP